MLPFAILYSLYRQFWNVHDLWSPIAVYYSIFRKVYVGLTWWTTRLQSTDFFFKSSTLNLAKVKLKFRVARWLNRSKKWWRARDETPHFENDKTRLNMDQNIQTQTYSLSSLSYPVPSPRFPYSIPVSCQQEGHLDGRLQSSSAVEQVGRAGPGIFDNLCRTFAWENKKSWLWNVWDSLYLYQTWELLLLNGITKLKTQVFTHY